MTIEAQPGDGPLRGIRSWRVRGDRSGTPRVHDPGRPRGRRDPHRAPRRPGIAGWLHMLLNRGRPSVALDLKRRAAVRSCSRLVEGADVLVEGMPGVTRRLGIGPDDCPRARNPRLVYGRMTRVGPGTVRSRPDRRPRHELASRSPARSSASAGQEPPARSRPTWSATSRRLDLPGHRDPRRAPRSAPAGRPGRRRRDRRRHRAPQHDDRGVPSPPAATGGTCRQPAGRWRAYYDIYETSDGRHMSVGALEPQFYDGSCACWASPTPRRTGTTPRRPTPCVPSSPTPSGSAPGPSGSGLRGHRRLRRRHHPAQRAGEHPHLKARGTLVQHDNHLQPAPAPRFSRTGATIGRVAESAGDSTREALAAWGRRRRRAARSGAAVRHEPEP